MKIHLATDHAGLELKNSIKDYLIKNIMMLKTMVPMNTMPKMTILILFFPAPKRLL
tara:strand:+ start:774 stop:941 length:168 start_codon:yes stop_codon:yes gene_type:complete